MNEVALIFGGSGGIGQAIYSIFKNKGFSVYLTAHKRIFKKKIPNVIYCDVTKNKDIKNVISYILKKETRIDVLINSVSPQLKLKTVESLSTKEFKEDIDTILVGGININKAIIPIMKASGSGIVVNILSSLVLGNVSTRMSSYISAKYGLLGFTKCLALELLPFNISVFGISPSLVRTNLIKSFPKKFIEMERNKRENRRLIQPVEVAKVVMDIVQNPQKYKPGENIEIK